MVTEYDEKGPEIAQHGHNKFRFWVDDEECVLTGYHRSLETGG